MSLTQLTASAARPFPLLSAVQCYCITPNTWQATGMICNTHTKTQSYEGEESLLLGVQPFSEVTFKTGGLSPSSSLVLCVSLSHEGNSSCNVCLDVGNVFRVWGNASLSGVVNGDKVILDNFFGNLISHKPVKKATQQTRKLFFIEVILSYNLIILLSMTKGLSPSNIFRLISIVKLCLDGRNYILYFLQFSRGYITIVIYSQRKPLLWPVAKREKFEIIIFFSGKRKLIIQFEK